VSGSPYSSHARRWENGHGQWGVEKSSPAYVGERGTGMTTRAQRRKWGGKRIKGGEGELADSPRGGPLSG
jgi:hypothetical protein